MLRQTLPPGFYRTLHPLGDASAQNASERKFLAALDDHIRLCALVEQNGGSVEQNAAGDTLTLAPGLTAEVLAPTKTRADALLAAMRGLYATPQGIPEFREKLDALDGGMNNFSLMLRLTFGSVRILLPGDTNRAGYGGIPPKRSPPTFSRSAITASSMVRTRLCCKASGRSSLYAARRATAATTALTPKPCAC